jgi:hypothetical protein
MSDSISKQKAYQLLDFASLDDMNLALMELAKCLEGMGKEVPEELKDPEKFEGITKEHLKLLRDYIRNALAEPGSAALPSGNSQPETPQQEPTNGNGNGSIVERFDESISAPPQTEAFVGALAGFRETLKQLGVQYVAKAAGYDISDSFFLALDKALAERNKQNLSERIDIYRAEFDSAVESIHQVAQERQEWEGETLGKFNAMADFTDLDKKLVSIQKK